MGLEPREAHKGSRAFTLFSAEPITLGSANKCGIRTGRACLRKKSTLHPCRGVTCHKATSQAELPVRERDPTFDRSIGRTDPLLQTPNLVFPLSAPVVGSSNDWAKRLAKLSGEPRCESLHVTV